MRRRALLSLLALSSVLAPVANAALAPGAAHAQTAPPKAWILVDADSGVVLNAGNEHEALPPASTVKIMTAITALEKLPLDSTVKISAKAEAQPSMRIGVHAGEVWRLNDALHAMLMVSANDAAYAIAEQAGGSLEGFAAAMNATGRRLGMRDSVFNDPAGLDDGQSYNGGSRMSAYDLTIAARNALKMQEIASTVSSLEYKFTSPDNVPHTLKNHNASFLKAYPGANGMKTGYTQRAGRGLVATATRNGRTMIAVVLNYYNYNDYATRLFDQGFSTPPNAKGVGYAIPATRVFTADDRLRAYDSLPRALGRTTVQTTDASPNEIAKQSTPSTVVVAGERVARSTKTRSGVAAPKGNGASSLFTLRNVLIVVAVLLFVLVALRRRAVKRKRRRRRAHQRALAEARRRGMIHVIDGGGRPPRSAVEVVRTRNFG